MNYFKRDSSLIFKGTTTLLLLIGLSLPGIVGSANSVHHYQTKTRRRAKIHHNGTIRLKRKGYKSNRSSSRQIQKTCSEISRQTIKDVNKDRRQRHVPQLRINHSLSQIGNERSHQIQKYFSHNVKYRKNEVRYLLNNRKIHYKYYGENIASSPLGVINMLNVGSYNTPNDANQHYITYHAKNGFQLANNVNNASIYHDKGDNNGHRYNDLSRQFKQMGVGVSYNQNDKNFYITIEFIG